MLLTTVLFVFYVIYIIYVIHMENLKLRVILQPWSRSKEHAKNENLKVSLVSMFGNLRR